MNLYNPYQLIFDRLEIIDAKINQATKSPNIPKYYTIVNAAEKLSISPNALRVMVFKRQIEYCKKGGKLYFKESDLIEYIESGRVNIGEQLFEPKDVLKPLRKGVSTDK